MEARTSTTSLSRSPHDQKGHSNSYVDSMLLLCLLLGIGLAISVSQSFGNHIDESKVPSKTVTLCYCTLMLALYFWAIVNKKSFEKRGVVHLCNCDGCMDTNIREHGGLPVESDALISQTSTDWYPYQHSNHTASHGPSLMPALMILGTGAAVYFLFENLIQIYCIVSVPYSGLQIAESILESCIYIIELSLVIIQIRFFRTYDRAVFKNLDFLNCVFAAAIGLNSWAWITCLIKPLERVKYPKIQYACTLNVTATIEFHDEFLGYVEPFLVESLTVATGILFQMWNRISENAAADTTNMTYAINISGHDDQDDSQVTPDRDTGLVSRIDANRVNSTYQGEEIRDYDRLEQHDLHLSRRHILQARPQPYMSSFTHIMTILRKHRFVGFSTLLSVICYSIFHGLIIQQVKIITEITSPRTRECIQLYLVVIFFIPSTCWMFICLYKTPPSTFKTRRFSSNDSLLLFTALWTFMIEIIHIIAAVGMIQTCPGFAIINIFPPVFILIQSWIQTKFIIIAIQTHALRGFDTKFIPCLIHLMIINLAEWFLIAFVRGMNSEKDIKEFFPIDIMWYGEEVVRVILVTLFPLVSLFRFHSSIMTYEVLKFV